MSAYRYEKWDPNGNTTLFFSDEVPSSEKPSAEEIAYALAPGQLNAEQAGFADNNRRHLRMAGGEFCVNATLAFGAHLDRLCGREKTNIRQYAVTVSGWPDEIGLTVQGEAPLWQVTADLTLQRNLLESISQDIVLVRLPGIKHLLVHVSSSLPAKRKDAGLAYLTEYRLLDEDAAGVIFWKESDGSDGCCSMSVWPVVRVRAVDTLYEETSCGSGSLALSCLAYLRDNCNELSVLQPGGAKLGIRMAEMNGPMFKASVTGCVRMAGEGEWQGR